jgi:very-short-patch-repair endonuclease
MRQRDCSSRVSSVDNLSANPDAFGASTPRWPGTMSQSTNHRSISGQLRSFAKKMRREPTDAEATMWRLLRDRRLAPFKFRRQVPFRNYILDFVCFEQRPVIEIDGSQHASSNVDATRDSLLRSEGFAVLRYWNNDVLQQRSAILEDILEKLSQQ